MNAEGQDAAAIVIFHREVEAAIEERRRAALEPTVDSLGSDPEVVRLTDGTVGIAPAWLAWVLNDAGLTE